MVIAVSVTKIAPDGKTDNQIGHILIDRRLHSSIPDVWGTVFEGR